MKKLLVILSMIVLLTACGPNREVNVDQGPGVREIHDEIELHFDEVTVNGVEYIILEKDRNNPDEGFGFMALKGNHLVSHTDSAIAYMRTMMEVQARILSKLDGISEKQAMNQINLLLEKNFTKTEIIKETGSLTGKRKKLK